MNWIFLVLLVQQSMQFTVILKENQKMCFQKKLEKHHHIVLQYMLSGPQESQFEATMTLNGKQILKTTEHHFYNSEADETMIQQEDALDKDSNVQLCFNLKKVMAYKPWVHLSIHFSQQKQMSSEPEELEDELVASNEIKKLIKRMKLSCQKLVSLLYDIQMNIEESEYNFIDYMETEQAVKSHTISKIILALIIFSIQLFIIIRFFKNKLGAQSLKV